MYRQFAIMQAMIEAGANLEKEDEHGERSLHWAVYRGMPDLIRALIEAGAKKYPLAIICIYEQVFLLSLNYLADSVSTFLRATCYR